MLNLTPNQLCDSVMPVQTKAQVIKLLQTHQQEIQDLGVTQFGLFGSFARNKNIQTQSDIDVIVTFSQNQKTFDNFMQLSFLLEELFERKVDLVTPESLSPHIGPHILNEVEYVSFDS